MSPSHNIGSAAGETKRRVLVVDDEPTLRLGFSYALSSRDTLVETASTGRQALEKIRENTYDIVILDLRMPDIDGLGVLETLRLAGNLVPIVLCSAALTPAAALRAIQHRVPDFLLKPIRPTDLRDVVDYILNPPDTPLSQAMVAARVGKMDTAIQHIREEAEHDRTCAAWLEVLESIVSPSGDSESQENGGFSSLAILAFRSSKAL
jgi:DNA-binding NtrC family response regulator